MKRSENLNSEPAVTENDRRKKDKPLIIAGPCSAESPMQLLETALALKDCKSVDYFRAGVWKPRTLPDSFQGVGSEGLKWLRDIKLETGMKVATEVGCEKHVLEALKYDIDLLWIGARTVSNPFVVQEIAESLRGVDIPVFVKNPLNPDLELWYGAINRFLKVGIKEVGAIHRGFSVWGKSIFRNPPIWEIPKALKERMPGIRIICDPSHITGKRSLVPLVSGRAMGEGMGGLMIEVHPEPEKAMSDAAQQLDPPAFSDLMNDLEIVSPHSSEDTDNTIDELSSEIEKVDDLIVHTIASRMELSRQIAMKENPGVSLSTQRSKSEKANGRLQGLAINDGLRPDFVNRLFDEINRESHHIKSPGAGMVGK